MATLGGWIVWPFRRDEPTSVWWVIWDDKKMLVTPTAGPESIEDTLLSKMLAAHEKLKDVPPRQHWIKVHPQNFELAERLFPNEIVQRTEKLPEVKWRNNDS